MRSRKPVLLVLVCTLGLGACSPAPERVFIDLNQCSLEVPGSAGSLTIVPKQLGALPQGKIDSLDARSILTDSASEMSQFAEQTIRRSQEKMYQEIRLRLMDAYRADLTLTLDKERQKLEAQFAKDLDSVHADMERRFNALAAKLGPKWNKIAWLVGFPDPDPNSKRKARAGDFDAERRLKLAAELRAEIKLLNEQFTAERVAAFESVIDSYRVDFESLEQAESDSIAASERKAESDARAAAIKNIRSFAGMVFDTDRLVQEVQGAVVSAQPRGAASKTLNSTPKTIWSKEDMMKDLALTFARSHGWRLAPAGPGVMNKTEDFCEWRKKNWHAN